MIIFLFFYTFIHASVKTANYGHTLCRESVQGMRLLLLALGLACSTLVGTAISAA
jgi:hypothetical protein